MFMTSVSKITLFNLRADMKVSKLIRDKEVENDKKSVTPLHPLPSACAYKPSKWFSQKFFKSAFAREVANIHWARSRILLQGLKILLEIEKLA